MKLLTVLPPGRETEEDFSLHILLCLLNFQPYACITYSKNFFKKLCFYESWAKQKEVRDLLKVGLIENCRPCNLNYLKSNKEPHAKWSWEQERLFYSGSTWINWMNEVFCFYTTETQVDVAGPINNKMQTFIFGCATALSRAAFSLSSWCFCFSLIFSSRNLLGREYILLTISRRK